MRRGADCEHAAGLPPTTVEEWGHPKGEAGGAR